MATDLMDSKSRGSLQPRRLTYLDHDSQSTLQKYTSIHLMHNSNFHNREWMYIVGYFPHKRFQGKEDEHDVSMEAYEIFASLKEQMTIWTDMYVNFLLSIKSTLIHHLSRPFTTPYS